MFIPQTHQKPLYIKHSVRKWHFIKQLLIALRFQMSKFLFEYYVYFCEMQVH